MTPKPVDTGGVEGGGEGRFVCPICKTPKKYAGLCGGGPNGSHKTVNVALVPPPTEKPTDSMGGGKDKGNGRSDDLRSVTDEAVGSVAALADNAMTDEDIALLRTLPAFDSDEVHRYPQDDDALAGAYNGLTEYGEGFAEDWEDDEDLPYRIKRTEAGDALLATIDRLIGEQQTEPANHSVTPSEPSASALNPTPVIVGIPTTPGKIIDPSPQPEKREGRYEVGDNLTLRPLFDGVSPPIPVYERLDTHTAAIANAAYLAGQKSQPEGDERSAGEEIKRLVEVAQNGRYDHRTDTFVVKSQLLVQIKHTAKRLAALGSGEGKDGVSHE